jgi:hypothetical protein
MRLMTAAALTIAAFACSAPEPAAQQPATSQAAAAQAPAAPQDAAKATGSLPGGWKARLDDAAAKPDAIRVAAEENSVTFTTGPAGIYYKPGMKAEKDYTVSATFSQLKPSTEPQPYGLFVAGADLDKDTPRYTALLVRSDGNYQIESRTGGQTRVIVAWKAAPQMKEPKGVKTSNTLTIRALQGAVHFLIADKEVHQMPRARAGGDGVAGVRIGSGLSVQVNGLAVKKFP